MSMRWRTGTGGDAVRGLTPQQCHETRMRLGWSTRRLATRAGVPWGEVISFEYRTRVVGEDVIAAIRRALVVVDVDAVKPARSPPGGA